jgi:hypothetical protein
LSIIQGFYPDAEEEIPYDLSGSKAPKVFLLILLWELNSLLHCRQYGTHQ